MSEAMLDQFDPNDIQDIEGARQAILYLLNLVEEVVSENRELREENQRLRDENNRLKGEQGKPKIKPSKKTPPPSANPVQFCCTTSRYFSTRCSPWTNPLRSINPSPVIRVSMGKGSP